MGASLSRYQPVGRGTCEGCTRPAALTCPRCRQTLCRKHYANTCAFEVGGHMLSFPVQLLLFRKHHVCDSCMPEQMREASFADEHGAFLIKGAVVTRVSQTLFSESKQAVSLHLDTSQRQFDWKTLELVRQEPKETGSFSLDDIAGVQTGDTAVSGAGVKRAHGGSPGTLTGVELDHTIRLVNDRGHTLFLFTCGNDRRAFLAWSSGMPELLAVARSPHCTFLPPRSSVSASARADVLSTQGRAQNAIARQERAAARQAFKDSLGSVGMAHTAQVLASRPSGRRGSEQDEEMATDGRGDAAVAGVLGPRPPGLGAAVSSMRANPLRGDSHALTTTERVQEAGTIALAQVSTGLGRLQANIQQNLPGQLQDVGRTLETGFKSLGTTARSFLRPPGG